MLIKIIACIRISISHGFKHPLLNLLSEFTNVAVYKISLQKSVVSFYSYAKEIHRYQENNSFLFTVTIKKIKYFREAEEFYIRIINTEEGN